MRALSKFLYFSVLSGAAHASTQTVISGIETSVSQSPLALNSQLNGQATQTYKATLGLQSTGYASGLQSQFLFSLERPDYRNVMIRDANQNASELAHPTRLEAKIDAEAGWAKGPRGFTVGYFGHVSPSPYAVRGIALKYFESFYEKSTVFSTELRTLEQNSPKDFFVDRDFKIKQRPQKIHASEAVLAWEQLITEKYKFKLTSSLAQRKEERPPYYSFRFLQGYAWSDRWFSTLELGRAAESTHSGLKNERGYFKVYSAKVEVSVEALYDFLASLSYGLQSEYESDPRTGTKTRIGSDQYGLGLKYTFNKTTVDFSGAYGITNSPLKFYSFKGGLQWQL